MTVPSPRPVLAFLAAALLAAGVAPPPAAPQIPDEFVNLQVLPEDISQDSLLAVMRGFSFATGLRCEGCHVLGEGNSFQGARFDLDDKPTKAKARVMLQMVRRLNGEILPTVPDRADPPVAVECKTCHRGLSLPLLLRTELHRVVVSEGPAAAVARYRELRETSAMDGVWDFGEQEMNQLARQLVAEGRTEAAVAILEVNEEFHPASSGVPALLGPLYERTGRTGDAVAAYRRALGRNPADARSEARLRALAGG